MADPPFVCPICQRRSWHPRDAAERFCGACGFVDDVTDEMLEAYWFGDPPHDDAPSRAADESKAKGGTDG